MGIFKQIFVTMCFLILLYLDSTTAKPRPALAWNSLVSDVKYCSPDLAVQELCQRCAKATKSNIAYPMCCQNEDNAYVWCNKYLNFGLQ